MVDPYITYLENYAPVIVFFILAIGLSFALLLVNYLRSSRHPDPEKSAPYECGFQAFDNTRHRFNVQFYLVAILFIIFDLEIAFLFPWAITLGQTGLSGFWSMMVFLSILTVGFAYEWKKGALEWE